MSKALPPSLDLLRRYAIARSLGTPSTLARAIDRLGFVQADPIRAPARAQDLILRHRVHDYRAGDLERHYARLDVDEDFFVNYGFLPRAADALMHPRGRLGGWPRPGRKAAADILAFVQSRGEAHPRDVDAHFGHGAITNYWGGQSSATTHLLDHLHYRGRLRVLRRDQGIRVYAPRPPAASAPRAGAAERRARADALLDLAVRLYAPVPSPTLAWLVNRLRLAAPQFTPELVDAKARARARLAQARVDGVEWYWPADDDLATLAQGVDHGVRLLAPFDPIVWDRRRFGGFWGWDYRFEAYTPAAKRKFGYYALPMLWRDRVIGWANVTSDGGVVQMAVGYTSGRAPRERAFATALEAERAALALCLAPR